jgi:glycosyltransferase involved in cell wall biosynthesis
MSEVTLSVVLPCRDQQDHIEGVLKSYVAPLEATGRSFELVVVPNACRDRTPEIVRALAAGEPRFRVADNPRGGWGLSVLAGLAVARGEVLCYTNSARTDPAHVVALLELYLRSAPCLAKVRREHRSAPLRELGSSLFNLEGRLLFGIGVADVNGTPKMLPRDAYERLDLFSQGDLLDMELLAKVHRLGLPVVELPVPGFRRHGGRSSTNLKSAWRMYAGALGLRRALADFAPSPSRRLA